VTSRSPGRAREARSITPLEVAERLRGETKIVIVSHEAPDGDALGSVTAFLLMADRLGIESRAHIPGDASIPPEYDFLPGVERIGRGPLELLPGDETVYALDCASLLRSNVGDLATGAVLVNIDHHQDNPGYGEFNLLDPEAASTSAILYEVFQAGGLPLDAKIATCLYVGLVTDTGRFQYSNTTPVAHRVAAGLQEAGVDVNAIYREIYEKTPLPKLRLLQTALDHLEVRLGGALVVSWLGNSDFVRAGAGEGHAEGLIDTLRRIQGVRVAALLKEMSQGGGGQVKASLRSTDGAVDVAAVARKRGGGGHVRAAGFTTEGTIPAAAAWIEEEVGRLL